MPLIVGSRVEVAQHENRDRQRHRSGPRGVAPGGALVAGHEVAWTADDGAEAIALARADPPDLILMDLFMPGIDGVEATRRIMGESPCAILVVTATVSGHLSKVYQAMGYGALDAIDTPTLGPRGEIAGAALLLHKIEVIGRLIGKPATAVASEARCVPSGGPVVAGRRPSAPLGSAGRARRLDRRPAGPGRGPRPAPRQLRGRDHHRPARRRGIRAGLGQWLAEQSQRRVTLIAEGQRPAAGEILLSGTDDHLVLGADRRLHYSPEPREARYRPSVDVFFTSVARNWPRPGVAALLTGMFHDGAAGLARAPPPGLAHHRPGRVVQRRLGHAQGRRRARRGRGGPAPRPRSPRRSCGSCPSSSQRVQRVTDASDHMIRYQDRVLRTLRTAGSLPA